MDWHDSIEDAPRANSNYAMFVSHELNDALPFHFIEEMPQGWKEVLLMPAHNPAAENYPQALTSAPGPCPVSVMSSFDSSTSKSKALSHPILEPGPTPVSTLLGASSPRFASLPIGAPMEVSAASFQTSRKLSTLLSQDSGGSARGAVD